MFLVALARPRFVEDRNEYFDGKIGCWAFLDTVLARRNSPRRPAGTPELKPINVTGEVYCRYMLERVIPAIREKWPINGPNHITIQ